MGAYDPHLSNVSLLMPMEGANNQTAFVDVSPTPKLITRYGDTKISTAQSKWGFGSGYFDGNGDYLTVAHDATLLLDGDFTVEWHVRLSAYALANTWPRIFAKHEDVSGGMICFYDSAGWCIAKFNGSTTIVVGTLLLNSWAHVAICRAGTTVTTFLNGTLKNSATVSGTAGGSNNIYLGQSYNGGWNTAGYLQDLRITKGVARYTANFTPPGRLVVPTFPDTRTPIAQSGTVTVSGNGGADIVAIHDASNRQLVTTAIPDEDTGAWTASVPPGDYTISYFAAGCRPVTHGPYPVAPS